MERIFARLTALVWGAPTVALMLGAGVFLTLRLRAFPQRKLRTACRRAFGGGDGGDGGLSARQTLCAALAGTVGTGNIAGVAGALALGGPGAVFWMWIAAFGGMATKFCEVALAVSMRTRGDDGRPCGGPMVYMRQGLGRAGRVLSPVFCAAGMAAALTMGSVTQISVAADAVRQAGASLGCTVPGWVLALCAGLLPALALLGGAGRVGAVAERLVPLMSGLYLFGTAAVILHGRAALPGALAAIVRGAWSPQAVGAGAAGTGIRAALRAGVSRGIFSNEAGLGSAPIVYAASDSDDAVGQGLLGVFEVFADTVVLCTLTALAVLCSGVPVPYGTEAGVGLFVAALGTAFSGPLPGLLTAAGLSLFALSSVLSWGFYGSRCAVSLLGREALRPWLLLFCTAAAFGACTAPTAAWLLADLCTALMTLCNLPAVILLSGRVRALVFSSKASSDYTKQGNNFSKNHTKIV